MTVKELEQRVRVLEEQVKRLSGELAAAAFDRSKGWLRSVEKYAGDEDLRAIFADAQKLREKDRRKAPLRPSARRKPKT